MVSLCREYRHGCDMVMFRAGAISDCIHRKKEREEIIGVKLVDMFKLIFRRR